MGLNLSKDCFCKRHKCKFMTNQFAQVIKKLTTKWCFVNVFFFILFLQKVRKDISKNALNTITENIDIIFLWNNIFLRSVKIQLSNKVKIKMIGVFNKNLLFSSSFFSVFTSKIWTEIDMIKISALNIFSTVPNFLEL